MAGQNQPPKVGDFTLIVVAAMAACCAPDNAFALLVSVLCGVAMCLLYKVNDKAMHVISDLCADLARVNETLKDVRAELKTVRKSLTIEMPAKKGFNDPR